MTASVCARATALKERIAALEPTLQALITPMTIHDEPPAGQPLSGLIGTVKDILTTQGVRTTAGSKMLADWIAPYDATAVARLRSAGAVLVGKTNCDAWAHGSSTENSDFGPTKNPWDTSRVPGGSSGGSAAAVAAGYGDFSIGTDTGGSIRQPAAFCGVTGLKPTYGRVSRYGLVAMASSLDVVGPIARDAAIVARVFQVIAGADPRDATTVPGRSFSAEVVTAPTDDSRPLAGKTVGIPREYFAKGLAPEIRTAVEEAISELEKLGASVRDVSLPSTPYALATYYIIQPAEVSSNLGRFDGVRYGHSIQKTHNSQLKTQNIGMIDLVKRNRAEGFGLEAKRRIILGTFVLSAGYVDAYYKKAMRVRTRLRQEFGAVFASVDFLATPTTPNPAFALGAKTSDPLAMYLEDAYTVACNLAGIPAVSIPCGFTSERLPIGLQLIGPMFSEELLLRTAHLYQQHTDWHRQSPPLFAAAKEQQ